MGTCSSVLILFVGGRGRGGGRLEERGGIDLHIGHVSGGWRSVGGKESTFETIAAHGPVLVSQIFAFHHLIHPMSAHTVGEALLRREVK